MIVPGEGKFPWRRVLGSLLAALLVAAAGFTALWADVEEPRPLHIAIEVIALPFVRLVYLIGGLRSAQAIWFAGLSSILVWWAIFFILLTWRARKRDAQRPA
jgi:hypothetical protein